MKDFDRDFRFMRRFIMAFIVIVFLLIIAIWGFYGFLAYKVVDTVQTTDNIPAQLGKMVGEFEKAKNAVK